MQGAKESSEETFFFFFFINPPPLPSKRRGALVHVRSGTINLRLCLGPRGGGGGVVMGVGDAQEVPHLSPGLLHTSSDSGTGHSNGARGSPTTSSPHQLVQPVGLSI